MRKQNDHVQNIKATLGNGIIMTLFKGKSFIECMIELIKNSRDWDARSIQIFTNENTIKIIDNGEGMNIANRNAFVSIGTTTASRSRKQAGKFCTGTKQMLFSQAENVIVRTAPKEEPNCVYLFEVSTETYEELILTNGSITPQRFIKDKSTWPYDSDFGTELLYTLKNPTRKTIFRGQRLAEELSARLPLKFQDIITIDNQPIPQKKIKGKIFSYFSDNRHLGEIGIELYNPEYKHREDGLRIGSLEIGEVPIDNFLRTLGERSNSIHSIFLRPEVCGNINASFFEAYSNQDRFTLDQSLRDDPRLHHFFKLLEEIASDVQRELEIKLNNSSTTTNSEKEIHEIATQITEIYRGDGKKPDTNTGSQHPSSSSNNSDPDEPHYAKAMIRLYHKPEFEPNEIIEIKVKLNPTFQKMGYKFEDIQWYLHRSKSSGLKMQPDGFTLTAGKELGIGIITGEVPGTSITVRTSYEIVRERVFKLNPTIIKLSIGSKCILTIENVDKIKGDVIWINNGNGELLIDENGIKAIYNATVIGTTEIIAKDSKSSCEATSHITITSGEQKNLMQIRKNWFQYDFVAIDGVEGFDRPIIMTKGEKIHRLTINALGKGFIEAEKQNILKNFLIQAIAQEFSMFSYFELEDVSITELDPRDFPNILANIRSTGFSIFAEMISGKK